MICLPSCSRGPGSRCAACSIQACESLKNADVVTKSICNLCLFSIARSCMSQTDYCSLSNISIRPVLRILWCELHPFPCFHTAAAPFWPSSERHQSVHHIQTPAAILASFFPALRCVAILAEEVMSWITVLTAGSSPGASQIMPSVLRQYSCSVLTTMGIDALEEGFLCSTASWCWQRFRTVTL